MSAIYTGYECDGKCGASIKHNHLSEWIVVIAHGIWHHFCSWRCLVEFALGPKEGR